MADRSKFDELIAELEADAFERGRKQGLAEGAAIERKRVASLLRLLGDLNAELEKMQQADVAETVEKQADEIKPPREGTDQHRVLEFIRAHPGSRGVDIVNQLNDVEERTIRTALFRLKHKNLIVNENGTWKPFSFPWIQKQEGQPLV